MLELATVLLSTGVDSAEVETTGVDSAEVDSAELDGVSAGVLTLYDG